MKIEDNFLEQKDFDELQNVIMSDKLSWFYLNLHFAKIEKDNISLEAELFSLDGKERFYYKASKELKLASELGKEAGTILKKDSKNSYKK